MNNKILLFIILYKEHNHIIKSEIMFNNIDVMGKKSIELLPQTMEILETMGEQIKIARLRRDISAQLVAERANISRATLWNIEKGSPSVAIGNYAAVLHALNNMDRDLLKVAKDDEFGRKLQDLNISTKKRASNKEK